MDEPFVFYTRKSEKYSNAIKSVSNRLKRFVWYRLSAFLLIFTPLILPGTDKWLTFTAASVFFIAFLFLVRKNIQTEKKKRRYEVLNKIVNDELLALQHKFDHFGDGAGFIDNDHFYSSDLDLFGEGSLFQFLNRTATSGGQQALADLLKEPPLQKDIILDRQVAVRELSKIPNWRLHFLARGHMFKETRELSEEIRSWSDATLELFRPALCRSLIVILPVLALLSVIHALMTNSYFLLAAIILLQWLMLFIWRKQISGYYSFFGRKSELLAKYMDLVKYVEEREFNAPLLVKLQQEVRKPESAGNIFRQLRRYVKQFEFRQNLVVIVVLNSFFLWDLRCLYKLNQWHRKNREKLAAWLKVIAEADALISLANLAYNQPGYNFPEIHDAGFILKADKMGHPLLNPAKRVDNDLVINGWSKVLIITGANMAGKSTFLRTVGVNMILARSGVPVCAESMIVTPVEVYTDMRTTDSLMKDESYFFAELKRIKRVLDRLIQGERFLVIPDEMLRGTNSVDKLNGSKDLIRSFIEYKAVALIATHDLKLSEMENEFPQMVVNKCFEIKIREDEMIFDYLLKDGVTQSMNAGYLMKKMGII